MSTFPGWSVLGTFSKFLRGYGMSYAVMLTVIKVLATIEVVATIKVVDGGVAVSECKRAFGGGQNSTLKKAMSDQCHGKSCVSPSAGLR